MTDIIFSKRGALGMITLARPHALNSLTLDMIQAMYQQLQTFANDDAIAAVLIHAQGDKAFCAGGDVRALYQIGKENPSSALDFFSQEYRLNEAIATFKKPYIALMQGLTFGGGIGISLHGAYPIAGTDCHLAMPETSIGLFPDVGASYILSRLPDGLGLYLALSGQRVTADEAYALKLVKQVVKRDAFDALIDKLSGFGCSDWKDFRISELDSYVEGSALLNHSDTQEINKISYEKINHYFSKKTLTEIMQGLKNAPDDAFARSTYELLTKKSPMSLAVTFEQIKKAKTLSLHQCLEMDYVLVKNFMKNNDFYEGVRALLIDKDGKPQWHPKSLLEVSMADVALYFE